MDLTPEDAEFRGARPETEDEVQEEMEAGAEASHRASDSTKKGHSASVNVNATHVKDFLKMFCEEERCEGSRRDVRRIIKEARRRDATSVRVLVSWRTGPGIG